MAAQVAAAADLFARQGASTTATAVSTEHLFSRGPMITTITIVMLVVASIFFSLRCYVRLFLQKNFATDDYLIVVSMLLYIVMSAFVLLGTSEGLGQHLSALEPEQIVQALKWTLFNEFFFFLSITFCKLSLAFLELRLDLAKWINWVLKVSIVIDIVVGVGIAFVLIFKCSPVEGSWEIFSKSTCIDTDILKILIDITTAADITLDWLYALLPIPTVWRLNINQVTKISITVVLGLGVLASIASLVRVRYLSNFTNTTDPLFNLSPLVILSVLEVSLGIIAGSASKLRPLLKAMGLVSGADASAASKSRSKPSKLMTRSANGEGSFPLFKSDNRGVDTGRSGQGQWMELKSPKASSRPVRDLNGDEAFDAAYGYNRNQFSASGGEDGDYSSREPGIALTVDYSVESHQNPRPPLQQKYSNSSLPSRSPSGAGAGPTRPTQPRGVTSSLSVRSVASAQTNMSQQSVMSTRQLSTNFRLSPTEEAHDPMPPSASYQSQYNNQYGAVGRHNVI